MSSRPYFETGIEELERLFKEHIHQRAVLGDLWAELTFRDRPRAARLRREIEGILGDELPPPPRSRRSDTPENQLDLIDEDE